MLANKILMGVSNGHVYGTDVFSPSAYTGNDGTQTIATGLDLASKGGLVWIKSRSSASYDNFLSDSLRGTTKIIRSNTQTAEITDSSAVTAFTATGFTLGNSSSVNKSIVTYAAWAFARTPRVFEVVTYTGNGAAGRAIAHGLGAAPELMIIKGRTDSSSPGNMLWAVYAAPNNNAYVQWLNTAAAKISVGLDWWTDNGTTRRSPDASNFYVGNAVQINGNGDTYVAYLFASFPGVSKVGSYVGNGTSQTISANFSTGARFVLIKRTDSTGDWYIWDTTRGIVAGNDPHLIANSSAAEVSGVDSVDPVSAGFVVKQNATTNINVSGATYLYLAFA